MLQDLDSIGTLEGCNTRPEIIRLLVREYKRKGLFSPGNGPIRAESRDSIMVWQIFRDAGNIPGIRTPCI